MMLPPETIQTSLLGAWRLMMGKADGLRLLDLTADGFWNSFFAVILALPALAVNWVPVAVDTLGPDASVAARLFYILRLAVVDLGAWLLPLALLALVPRQFGIRDRYVHYVVANNWASVPLVWMMLPPSLLSIFVPSSSEFITLVALVLFVLSMVLTWRVTNLAIGKGPAVGSAVFAGMFVASIIIMLLLQTLLGIELPAG